MIRFAVSYYAKGKFSHSYDEGWEKTEFYCPHCGKQAVWHETSGGDYYVGEGHLCAECGAYFHLPSGAAPRPKDEQDKQRLVAIRQSAARDGTQEKK